MSLLPQLAQTFPGMPTDSRKSPLRTTSESSFPEIKPPSRGTTGAGDHDLKHEDSQSSFMGVPSIPFKPHHSSQGFLRPVTSPQEDEESHKLPSISAKHGDGASHGSHARPIRFPVINNFVNSDDGATPLSAASAMKDLNKHSATMPARPVISGGDRSPLREGTMSGHNYPAALPLRGEERAQWQAEVQRANQELLERIKHQKSAYSAKKIRRELRKLRAAVREKKAAAAAAALKDHDPLSGESSDHFRPGTLLMEPGEFDLPPPASLQEQRSPPRPFRPSQEFSLLPRRELTEEQVEVMRRRTEVMHRTAELSRRRAIQWRGGVKDSTPLSLSIGSGRTRHLEPITPNSISTLSMQDGDGHSPTDSPTNSTSSTVKGPSSLASNSNSISNSKETSQLPITDASSTSLQGQSSQQQQLHQEVLEKVAHLTNLKAAKRGSTKRSGRKSKKTSSSTETTPVALATSAAASESVPDSLSAPAPVPSSEPEIIVATTSEASLEVTATTITDPVGSEESTIASSVLPPDANLDGVLMYLQGTGIKPTSGLAPVHDAIAARERARLVSTDADELILSDEVITRDEQSGELRDDLVVTGVALNADKKTASGAIQEEDTVEVKALGPAGEKVSARLVAGFKPEQIPSAPAAVAIASTEEAAVTSTTTTKAVESTEETTFPTEESVVAFTEETVPSKEEVLIFTEEAVPSKEEAIIFTEEPVASTEEAAVTSTTMTKAVESTEETTVPTDESVVAFTEEAVPSTAEVLIFTEEAVPSTTEVLIVTEEPVSSTEEAVIVKEEPVPSTAEAVIVTEEPVPSTEEAVIVTEEPVPSTAEAVIVTEEKELSTAEILIVTEGTEPSTAEVLIVTEEPEPSTEEAVIVTEQPVPSTDEAVILTEEAVPSTEEAVIVTEEAVPSTAEILILTEEPVPSTEEAVIVTEEAVPSTDEAVIVTEEPVPSTEEAVIVTEEPVPSTGEGVVLSEEATAGEVIVLSEEPSSTGEIVVVTEEAVPSTTEEAVVITEAVAPAEEVATSTEAAPSTEEAVIVTEEPTPLTEEAVIVTEEATPSTEEAVIVTEDATPSTEEVVVFTEDPVVFTEAAVSPTQEVVVFTEEPVISSEDAAVTLSGESILSNTVSEAVHSSTTSEAVTPEDEAPAPAQQLLVDPTPSESVPQIEIVGSAEPSLKTFDDESPSFVRVTESDSSASLQPVEVTSSESALEVTSAEPVTVTSSEPVEVAWAEPVMVTSSEPAVEVTSSESAVEVASAEPVTVMTSSEPQPTEVIPEGSPSLTTPSPAQESDEKLAHDESASAISAASANADLTDDIRVFVDSVLLEVQKEISQNSSLSESVKADLSGTAPVSTVVEALPQEPLSSIPPPAADAVKESLSDTAPVPLMVDSEPVSNAAPVSYDVKEVLSDDIQKVQDDPQSDDPENDPDFQSKLHSFVDSVFDEVGLNLEPSHSRPIEVAA